MGRKVLGHAGKHQESLLREGDRQSFGKHGSAIKGK